MPAYRPPESYVITTSLPPVLVIATQLLGGILFGILGFAPATPLLAMALVLVKRLYVDDRLGDSFGKPLEPGGEKAATS